MTQYHYTPVLEFHQRFGHPVAETPTVPDASIRMLRVKLIAEELQELAHNSGVGLTIAADGRINVWDSGKPVDLVEVADALGDLRYVVDGGNLVYGIPGDAVLDEIHRSNMSKLGADGNPVVRADGKILKGPDYTPPDIGRVLFHARCYEAASRAPEQITDPTHAPAVEASGSASGASEATASNAPNAGTQADTPPAESANQGATEGSV